LCQWRAARVRRRLGHHHDHRRVGATGMVVLMEPGGRPSLGQVSSCRCIMVAVGRRQWDLVVGRAVRVCFPSRRTCHWPCQWRVLVVCYYYKREVALGALCELAKHKMGPAFSHFVVSEGAFLSSLSCTVHLRAVHMARSRPAGPRDVVCSRKLIPVLWPLCAVAR
jgi:hypothetical protein